MAMYQRKRRKPVSEINVVPYIDVMLVLLIIFMVTAPLISQGVKVDLPRADAQPIEQEEVPPLIASMDKNGLYYLNIGSNPKQSLTRPDLQALVKAELENNPSKPVVIKADGAVSYDQIIQLMVILQNAGVPSVGLMTEPKE
ncbi:MAG: Biopolymer transport protein ExbD [Glaciecola sp. HTCC2999]|jgi:biopolymer transport protein TolR|nr:MAG: Biopolymer transport protein ExbD [Glaciecola sp. HTCC2999]